MLCDAAGDDEKAKGLCALLDEAMAESLVVVTQPPAAKNRGRKLMPSAVAQLALHRGFPDELIFTPERAREESFLSDLKEVKPDVCITAAYGNILPQKFLDIPPRDILFSRLRRI